MKRFGGLLPCKADLERLGLSGLVCQMNCHPEAFAHIEQERRTRNQQRVVARAELLATLNGGFLTTKQWLENNGYNDVLLLRRLRPKLLLHLTMANLDNKIFPAGSKWVPVVFKLARQNRGSLPCLDWLKHKGFGPMVRAIKRHRKMFKQLRRTADEYGMAKDARNQGQQEHGLLGMDFRLECWLLILGPHFVNSNELKTRQSKGTHSKINTMKRKAPGILPNPHWLEDNGYSGLTQAMRQHPMAFAHIRQNSRRGKQPEQWVSEAEKLAKKYGRLPHPSWLQANGYHGLDDARRKHPTRLVTSHKTKRNGR